MLLTPSGDWSTVGRLPSRHLWGGFPRYESFKALWFSEPTQAKMSGVATADQTDINATLNGDGDAYGRIVARYQQEVGRWMWRFTRDRAEWEILVQDVFVEAYSSLHRFRGDGPLGAWLRTISTRVGYRFWTRRKRSAETSWSLQEWDQLASPADVEATTPEEAAEKVHQLLATVAPRDRLVLTLHYLEGLSVAQIAEHTGWTKTMVKVQMHRARQRLRKKLQK